MAYLVLALGALLSVGGGLSIFYGAGIVEVERGWTGVIAGATSLTGGILTIALGLILRTLLDMRAAANRAPVASAERALEPASPALPEPAPTIPAAPLAGVDLEGDLLAAFLSPQPEGGAASANLPPSQAEADEPVLPARPHPEVAPAPPVPAGEPGEPARARSRLRIGFKTPAAEPAAPPEPSAAEQSPVPAMDDWLDRAFSSLDSELGAGAETPRRGTAALPAPHGEARVETYPDASAGHDVAELDRLSPPEIQPHEVPPHDAVPHEPILATPAAPVPAAHSAAAPPSAVIGRYEADGTSYVMFADGSIETQSEAGVYRFSSMTELKAFIEGTG